jgi:hypothetical protein
MHEMIPTVISTSASMGSFDSARLAPRYAQDDTMGNDDRRRLTAGGCRPMSDDCRRMTDDYSAEPNLPIFR